MYEKLNLFNGTILNSQHLAHIEDGIANNSKAVEKNVAVAVETSYNSHTHVITFKVKNALGEIISTSTIDLPTESAIININDIVINGKKYLRFTTVNGSTFDVEMDEMFVNLVNEETFSNAIQNINEQISQLQTDVSNSKNDISNLKSFAENTNKSLANLEQTDIITNKRLANLESATLDFIEDSSIAYQKTVPENALPYAEVTKIGGMTRKCTNILPFPYEKESVSLNGGIFTVESDGGISASGTPTDYVDIVLYNDKPLSNSTITISMSGVYDNVMCSFDMYDKEGSVVYSQAITYGSLTTDISEYPTASKMRIGLKRNANNRAMSGKVYVMLNIGSTALPYEPYFEGLRSAPVSELVSISKNKLSPFIKGYKIKDDGNTYASDISACTDYIEVHDFDSGLYCLSGLNDQLVSFVTMYDKDKKYLGRTGANPYTTMNIVERTSSSMLSSAEMVRVRYLRVCSYESSTTTGMISLIDTLKPVLYSGTTSSPPEYTPYFKRTLPIPEAVRAIEGYGVGIPNSTDYNYIEWCEDGTKTLNAKAKEKTLTEKIGWDMRADIVVDGCAVFQYVNNNEKAYNGNIIAKGFETVVGTHDHFAYSIRAAYYSTADVTQNIIQVCVPNTVASTNAEFKAYLSSNPIQCVVGYQEPEVTDISDILTDDNFIEVEGGGSITAVNEFGYDVPTTINYATDIGE